MLLFVSRCAVFAEPVEHAQLLTALVSRTNPGAGLCRTKSRTHTHPRAHEQVPRVPPKLANTNLRRCVNLKRCRDLCRWRNSCLARFVPQFRECCCVARAKLAKSKARFGGILLRAKIPAPTISNGVFSKGAPTLLQPGRKITKKQRSLNKFARHSCISRWQTHFPRSRCLHARLAYGPA